MILERSGTICAGTDFKGFGTDLNDLGIKKPQKKKQSKTPLYFLSTRIKNFYR
jgi:hypothetical protein